LKLSVKISNVAGQEARGGCRKCGMLGHLTFQCRNTPAIPLSSDLHSSSGSDSDESRTEAEQAIAVTERLAVCDDSWSQCLLGWMYDKGKGKPLDASKAVRLYAKSAVQGNATGRYNLGVCYETGHGVKKDMTKAVKHYQIAASQGNTWAQYNLALCHSNGDGVSKDLVKAAEYLQQAAKQGDAWALCALALAHERATGVSRDMEKAISLYRESAERGCPTAQYNLAVFYMHGQHGVPCDPEIMYELLTRAAEQGLSAAKAALVRNYGKSSGVLKDMKEVVLHEYGAAACDLKTNTQLDINKAAALYGSIVESCQRDNVPPPFASRALVSATHRMYWRTIRLLWIAVHKNSSSCLLSSLSVCLIEYLIEFIAPVISQTLKD